MLLLGSLGWSLLTAMPAAVGPLLFIVGGVVFGRYDDDHLASRRHRMLAPAVALVVTSLALPHAFAAPRDVIAIQVAYLAGQAVTAPIAGRSPPWSPRGSARTG